MLVHAREHVHGAAPFGSRKPKAARRMEVDAAIGRQPMTAPAAVPIVGRGHRVRPGERSGKRVRRRVAGLQRNLDDALAGRSQPVRRPLQQQPAAKPARRLAERRTD